MTDNNQLPPLRDIAGQLQAMAADLSTQNMHVASEKAMDCAEHLFEHARAALAQRQGESQVIDERKPAESAQVGVDFGDDSYRRATAPAPVAPSEGGHEAWYVDEMVASIRGLAAECAPVAPIEAEPTTNYVQRVPDHCDRITWRNRYYHLPLDGAAPVEPTGWTMIGPDGSMFNAEAPLKAASLANRHRCEIDPVAAKQFTDAIADIRRESEEENARLIAEHGSLNCPACGGSGHVGDTKPVQMWLYEHEDGRGIVALPGAAILAGDPAWHRVGPIEVHADALTVATQPPETDPNAPWLTDAHTLCTDYGIAQGKIEVRIAALRGVLAATCIRTSGGLLIQTGG